jgi:hypothetical protein
MIKKLKNAKTLGWLFSQAYSTWGNGFLNVHIQYLHEPLLFSKTAETNQC